jgi:hypothetical protein
MRALFDRKLKLTLGDPAAPSQESSVISLTGQEKWRPGRGIR